NQEMYPEDLLTGDLSQKLAGWTDSKITSDRIQTLLNRGSALAMAMEKWTRSGLWVLTRSDSDYPKRLKARLGNDAPPVFFGCGNRNLLNQGGIAVIGSRKTSDADLQFSHDLGAKSANDGRSVVSGGAKGVDEAAMLGALESEGTAIGVLANDLLRAATSAKYRKYLMANNLVLLSPFYPEAGFNAGNAMQRNKYIYCLSDA
ncbi:DNA-processing protein DprA, partial [Marinobacter sp. Z-F4-2]